MRIGIYTPIGDLEKYGYRYNKDIVLQNLQDFADQVFIISSSRKNSEGDFKNYKKIYLISNNKTWFEIKNNREVFSLAKQIKNQLIAYNYFKKNNFDAYLILHINQYIPENSVKGIRDACEKMLNQKKPYEWLYKKYQLLDVIFNADTRLPWIVNVKTNHPYRINSDSIKNQDTKEVIKIKHGNYGKYNYRAIVDISGEFTLEDAKEKYEFTIEELRKLNKTYNPDDRSNLIFNKEQFIQYHINKINNKNISGERLDKTGEEIIKNRRPNFLSHLYKKNYRPTKKTILSTLINQIKGTLNY